MSELSDTIAFVEEGLEDAERSAGTYADDPTGYHARHHAAMKALSVNLARQTGATINDRWDGARVRILGITSSSTTGIAGALRNWLAAARRKEGL